MDAILHQRLDRRFCGLLGRVQKCQESNQHHIRLIRHGELTHRGGVGLLGHGDTPHPILVQLMRLVQNKPAHLVRQRTDLAAALGPGAAPEHLLHRALGDQLGLAVPVLDHHAHPAALKVEGDLIHLRVPLCQLPRAQLLLLGDDRQVDEILQPRLEVAVQKRVAQDPVVLLAVDV